MRWLVLLALCTVSASPRYMKVEATAYCPCSICTNGQGITKTGRSAATKGIAVDPNIIPLNSRLDIPGYGSWILADDVGGAIKGHRIDIRMQNHRDAVAYGRKQLKIRVWEEIE